MRNRIAQLLTMLLGILLPGYTARGQCDPSGVVPEISVMLGKCLGEEFIYAFQEEHKDSESGTFIVRLDDGWVSLVPLLDGTVAIRARLDTLQSSETSFRARLRVETLSGEPFRTGDTYTCFSPGTQYYGVKLQQVTVTGYEQESRQLQIPGAYQLRSIKSTLYGDGQLIRLPFFPQHRTMTYLNVGVGPYFLDDGYIQGDESDKKVFYNPDDPGDLDYPGYRLVGTPDDVTVNPLDPADLNYNGVVLPLYDLCWLDHNNLEVDRLELDFEFDVSAPGESGDADRFVDRSEYEAFFGSLPAADPGAGTGDPSLFDGLEAQLAFHPTDNTGAPSAGDGMDPFMLDGPEKTRDDFYASSEGFLNTLGKQHAPILIPILDELRGIDPDNADLYTNRIDAFAFDSTWERVRLQSAVVVGHTWLEIDFGDNAPSVKMRFDGSFAIEVWTDDVDDPIFIYEIDGYFFDEIENTIDDELEALTQMVSEVNKWVGWAFGVYDFVTVRGCDFLMNWSEIYDPPVRPDCDVSCVFFYDDLRNFLAIFSTAFDDWGVLVTLASPVICDYNCEYLHDQGNFTERRLEAAADFLLDARQYLIQNNVCN